MVPTLASLRPIGKLSGFTYNFRMSEPIEIRRGHVNDAAQIAEFQIAMAWETEQKRLDPATVGPAVQAVFADPSKGFYVVAEHAISAGGAVLSAGGEGGRDLIASLLVTFEWSDWRNSNMWYIQSVFVAPAFRRQGIFKRMYTQIVAMAASHQVRYVRLYVEMENQAAQNVYQSLGMKRLPYFMYQSDL